MVGLDTQVIADQKRIEVRTINGKDPSSFSTEGGEVPQRESAHTKRLRGPFIASVVRPK